VTSLQERMKQGDTAIWLNHTGCPGVAPMLDGIWPRMQPDKSSHYQWQDTYTCPKCDLRVVVTLVKEKTHKA
jgi:hypothetical protein